jgi:hypothetical protein
MSYEIVSVATRSEFCCLIKISPLHEGGEYGAEIFAYSMYGDVIIIKSIWKILVFITG